MTGGETARGPYSLRSRKGASVSTLLPERREYRNEPVRLADLTVNTDFIRGVTFENCQILGPAVLAPVGKTSIVHCQFDAGSFESFAWPFPNDREQLIGAIGAEDCRFFRCLFVMVGLAVAESKLEDTRAGFEAG